jgi:hypothetical protein
MNESMEKSDTGYFSQRAKHISLLNKQSSSVVVKPSPPPSSEVHFRFSNRTYVPIKEPQLTPVGRGHGSSFPNDHQQSISTGRGRTTVPLSSFILQKDNVSPVSTTNTISSPIFVMHDEVQFVRPYFGPPSNNDMQSSSLTAQKREVLLSALKEIESGLKTL